VARDTEGNPLFVTELLRLLESEGSVLTEREGRTALAVPPGVRDVIGRRLNGLSPACGDALGVAPVIGREFAVPLLEHAAATGPLLEVLAEAEPARLIVPEGSVAGRYRFSHALVRETLYDELPAAVRVALHRRVGQALAALYAADPEPHLAELAHHAIQAAPGGDALQAASYARRAGDRALTLLAYEEAAAAYARALEVLTLYGAGDADLRCELLLSLGKARARAGQPAAARDAFEQAAALARRLGAHVALARAALGFAGESGAAGVVDERVIALIEEALAALGEDEDALWARLLARLTIELYFSDEVARRDALSRAAVDLARRSREPATLAYALGARHFALWEPDTAPERLALAAELLELAERGGNTRLVLEGLLWQISDLLEAGEVAAARLAIERHARLAEELRQPLYRWHAARFRAVCAYLDGDRPAAERAAQEAAALAEHAGLPGAAVLSASLLQYLRREQGRHPEVEASVRDVTACFPRVAEGWRCILVNVLIQAGREQEARAELEHLSRTASAPSAVTRTRSASPACWQRRARCWRIGPAPPPSTTYSSPTPAASPSRAPPPTATARCPPTWACWRAGSGAGGTRNRTSPRRRRWRSAPVSRPSSLAAGASTARYCWSAARPRTPPAGGSCWSGHGPQRNGWEWRVWSPARSGCLVRSRRARMRPA
jgi:hypothetical protein